MKLIESSFSDRSSTVAAALAVARVTNGEAHLAAMADRIVENADQIVDEMKRKARRRLVGAIVLALAAAILLPMLLESEPRPLGDDVSVKIPPVDEGKFVNRLTGKSATPKRLPKADEQGRFEGGTAKTEARSETGRAAAHRGARRARGAGIRTGEQDP